MTDLPIPDLIPDPAPSQDDFFMTRALTLARESAGLASPNPQVGCVLVRDGVIVGKGAHLYDRRDHAEIAALKQAGDHARGATAYVTLEPCSHHGRTGPCSDALIAARVKRVVVGTVDPNPLVSGLARLRSASIDVTVGVLQQAARDLNEAFAHYIQTRRPLVTLKAALSVDGYLAPHAADRTPGHPHWLTGTAARTHVQELRHASDAILTGIGTVLADDPALTDRSGRPRRRPLLRVVLDSQLRTAPHSQLVKTAAQGTAAETDLLLLCSEAAPKERERALLSQAPGRLQIHRIHSVTRGYLDLNAVLEHLGRRNLLSILLEAGSELNGAFLTSDLVDRAVLFFAERELGPSALPFARGFPSPFLLQQQMIRPTRTSFTSEGQTDACITGLLRDPWKLPPADAP